jgi:3-oxoadipate enol-lactonase
MSWSELAVTVPGGRLRVQSRGQGPPVLWTHGMFHPIEVDERTTVGRVLGSLRRCRLIRYDTRGHGRSPPAATDEAHTWARLGEELLELADTLGLERFVAGGISMGAAVSLHAAVKAPGRLLGMVLLAPPTGWDTRPPQLQDYSDLAELGAPERVAKAIAAQLAAAFPEGTPLPLQAMVEGIRRADPDALGRVLRAAAMSDLPERTALAPLTIPTLVLPWDADPGHPLSTAREIARALPGARLEQVAGVDDYEGMLAAMQRFVDER